MLSFPVSCCGIEYVARAIGPKKILIKYLFTSSIILELLHLVIPARMFQWSDLLGNVFGVLLIYVLYNLKKKYE